MTRRTKGAPSRPVPVLTDAQRRARCEALFEEVRNQLYRVHTNWSLYVLLYGSRSNVELLRETAWVTFGAIQELLTQAIFMGIHRLLDGGTSKGGRRTASMETLFSYLPSTSAPLRRRLKRQLSEVRWDCSALSEWRDRHLAHRDEATALGEHPVPLQSVKERSAGAAIEFFATALSDISDELNLNLRYDLRHELDDLDVLELLRRLRAARNL